EDNLRSWKELQLFFGNRLGTELPVVIALNKWDKPNPLSRRALASKLHLNNGVHFVQTIATNGHNIKEVFSLIIQAVFQQTR
ncbi:MAG: GTPase domain-containing protein, partial [Candidatus Hermodarchaeota archaeon]|nr:GTPase domain-containing protein [Candidatus Hermodarchaeota archaeon]